MSINVNDKNLGHATAYAYYKAGGGTMTEAEFTEFMADFGTASQTAVEAAQAALASKNAAQTAATTATNKASEATTAATTATNKAAEAQADADAAALDASQALSAASTATTKATEATTAAATATSAKTDAVAANTAAQSAKTAAQTAQTGAETAAASVQSSAAQIATNTEDIAQLKSELTTFVGCEYLTFTNGKYIKTNLNVGDLVDLTPVTGYNTNNYAIVDVQEGDRFTINATGGNTGRLWCFVDSTNHLISVSDANVTASDLVLVAPEYASKLIINPVTGYGDIFIGENLNKAINKLLSADSTINMSIALTGAGVKYPTPASMDMFEKIVFDTDIGYAPQGIAVYNGIAYVSNGATPPLNVITEINLLDGTFAKHTISGLVSGGNSVSIDPQNNVLYVASHNDRGLVNIVDMNTWSMLGTARMSNIGEAPEPNIVYDPSERCFYNYGITKIYKLDETFKTIKEIPLQLTQNNYPLAKPGTTQGFGYDGTFFYIPRSEVYDVYGSSYTFVFNKNGEFIKYYRGLHKEIEEYAYDLATGKSYACYAYSATGWITEFMTDSGWLNLCDYLVSGIESTTPATNVDSANSTAKIRVKDGMVTLKGYLKVNASATTNVIAYLDARFAPMVGATAILRQTDSATFTNVTEFPCEISFLNPYTVPDFRYMGSPIRGSQTGFIWFDGVCLPYGRRTDNQGMS